MFRQSSSDSDSSFFWHMVMIKGGEEKRTRDLYAEWGVFSFYPTREGMVFNRSTRTYEKKKVPMFKTFLFVKFPKPPNWFFLKGRGMASGVLSTSGVPYRFSHEEIVAVRNMTRVLRANCVKIENKPDNVIREGDTVSAVPNSIAEMLIGSGKELKVKDVNQFGVTLSDFTFVFSANSLQKSPKTQSEKIL